MRSRAGPTLSDALWQNKNYTELQKGNSHATETGSRKSPDMKTTWATADNSLESLVETRRSRLKTSGDEGKPTAGQTQPSHEPLSCSGDAVGCSAN